MSDLRELEEQAETRAAGLAHLQSEVGSVGDRVRRLSVDCDVLESTVEGWDLEGLQQKADTLKATAERLGTVLDQIKRGENPYVGDLIGS